MSDESDSSSDSQEENCMRELTEEEIEKQCAEKFWNVPYSAVADRQSLRDNDAELQKTSLLRSEDEYKVLIAHFVIGGKPWKELQSIAFDGEQNLKVAREKVKAMYVDALQVAVTESLCSSLQHLCTKNSKELLDIISTDSFAHINRIDSKVWKDILRWSALNYDFHWRRLDELVSHLRDDDTRQRKVVGCCKKLLNSIVPYFYDQQAEKRLVRTVEKWFSSGDMTLSELKRWRRLKDDVTFAHLKAPDFRASGSEASIEFQEALSDCRVLSEVTLDQLREFLKWSVDIKYHRSDKRSTHLELEITAGCAFLSELIETIEDNLRSSISGSNHSSGVREIAIYCKHFLAIDCDIKNGLFHGLNVAIVAEKVVVTRQSTIDLSGIGHSTAVCAQAARSTTNSADGANGSDGRAGESSGNLTILSETIRNLHLLHVKLNGGDGEGGQDGGRGEDGHKGIINDKDALDKLKPNASSLYFSLWQTFKDHAPCGWSETTFEHRWTSQEQFVYKTFEHGDKRKLTYHFSGDIGFFCTTYDLLLILEGEAGTAGGHGGVNGLGGEGGRGGSLVAKNLLNGAPLGSFVVENRPGLDGVHGKCGDPGKPGSNGNDVAMVDRSSTGDVKKFFGHEKRVKLELQYFPKSTSRTRFIGYRKNRQLDCYARIVEKQIESIGEHKATEERTSANRTSISRTEPQQPIQTDAIVNRFNKIFSECKGTVGNVSSVIQNFAVGDEVEEQREQAQEEISIVRQHREDRRAYEETMAQNMLKPEEVLTRLQKANGTGASAENLVRIMKDIFQVPLDVRKEEKVLEEICRQLCQYVGSNFSQTIENKLRMSEKQYHELLQDFKRDLREKMALSSINQRTIPETEGSIEIVNNELLDVCPVELDDFFKGLNEPKEKKKLLDSFFEMVQLYHFVRAVVLQMYKINKHLTIHEGVFKKFENDSISWVETNSVVAFLKTFLTEKETTTLNESENEARQELQLLNDQHEVDFETIEAKDLDAMPSQTDDPSIIERSKKWMWQKAIATKNYLLSSKMKPKNYEDVYEAFLDGSNKATTEDVFKELNNLITSNPRLSEYLCIECSKTGPRPPGSSAMSIVHMFFVCRKVLNFALILYPVHEGYVNQDYDVPRDYISPDSRDSAMKGYDMISQWKQDVEIDSDMKKTFLRKGLKSLGYRRLVALERNVNLITFCSSGSSKMRVVENINRDASEKKMLYISPSGELHSISANKSMRVLRSTVESCVINVDLPQTTKPLTLYNFYPPAFKGQMELWTDSLKCFGLDRTLMLIQRLCELRGPATNIAELQFCLNTFLEACQVYGISEESMCKRVLGEHGIIQDISLALRLSAKSKENVQSLEELTTRLSVIKEPTLKALLASKLHEAELSSDDVESLINMLAHAEGRVNDLQQLRLSDWLDISRCQQWTSYEHILKEYGAIGYYLILLDSSSSSNAESRNNRSSDKLAAVINKLRAKKRLVIHEKFISRLTSLLANNEIQLNDEKISQISSLMQECSDRFEHYKPPPGTLQICGDNLALNTEERTQNIIMKYVRKGTLWHHVFPNSERDLSELLRLTINPHDTKEEAQKRAKTQSLVGEIVSGKHVDNEYYKILLQIDEQLKKTKKSLRNTQKIAILCAVLSEQNLLAQVNTGEGKSYIIASLAVMRVLLNRRATVDIITSSPVLAQRDAEELRDFYSAFKITVAHNCCEDVEKRQKAYQCSVVYGDIARFQRDYLIHEFYKKNILGSRTRSHVIVDEVDSMLLDNGSNMLYLSHNVPGLELLDSLFAFIQKQIFVGSAHRDQLPSTPSIRKNVLADLYGVVHKEDLSPLLKNLERSNHHVSTVWRLLLSHGVIDDEGVLIRDANVDSAFFTSLNTECGSETSRRVSTMLELINKRRQEIEVPAYLRQFTIRHLDEFIDNAKKALFVSHKREYVVDLDRTGRSSDLHPVVTILDQGTGTDLATSQWSEGLHQFLQLKHGCRLTPMSLKAVFISNVSYLKGYDHLDGFSGTLGSFEESKCLRTLYNADLLRIPTWKPKQFHENVPVLAKSSHEWIKSIFDEICDQVLANRSVLLICKSIEELEKIEAGLLSEYRQLDEPITAIRECFTNMIVYKREHDEFDASIVNGFACRRLIISTNLAGRGTDIKLTEELASDDIGGLHVIVSFLPPNSRIEDQAYGRAARCGQPGSGQIIALSEDENSNIFQLKQFRNNAEVHRLHSLHDFYHYHIDVEEHCFGLFHDHCRGVMSAICDVDDNVMPTLSQVIYFALLDEWALWLDSIADDVKICERNKSESHKQYIIASMKTFLSGHPLPISENNNHAIHIGHDIAATKSPKSSTSLHQENEGTNPISWIVSPQSLLTIAIIFLQNAIDNNDDQSENQATGLLDKIVKDYPEFSGEANYYLGIICQRRIFRFVTIQDQDVCGLFKIPYSKMNDLLSKLPTNDLPPKVVEHVPKNIEAAQKHFLQARSAIVQRIRSRNEMKTSVGRLQEMSNFLMSQGFAAQQNESVAVLQALIDNIDEILGHRIQPDEIGEKGQKPHLALSMFREFQRAAVISPLLLADHINPQQMQMISNAHGISPFQFIAAIEAIRDDLENADNTSVEGLGVSEFAGRPVLDCKLLSKLFNLPSVTGFWNSLQRSGCFFKVDSFLAIKTHDVNRVDCVRNLKRFELKRGPLQIQKSPINLDDYALFELNDKISNLPQKVNEELEGCLELGIVQLECIAELNPLAVTALQHADEFDFIDVADFIVELGIDEENAEVLLQDLINFGILQRTLVKVINANILSKELKKNMPANGNNTTDAECGADSAAEKPVIEPVYRLRGRIDCAAIPDNMRSQVEAMLTKHFSYGYALQSLKMHVKSTIQSSETFPYRIVLPADPYTDLLNDLIACGVLIPPTVQSTAVAMLEDYEKDHYYTEDILKLLKDKTGKLLQGSARLEMTSEYLLEKNVAAGPETRRAIGNGLRKAAVVYKPNKWKWYLGVFLVVAIVGLIVISIFSAPMLPLALLAVAAVGTFLFTMMVINHNQKLSSRQNVSHEEEFKILQQFNDAALRGQHQMEKQNDSRKSLHTAQSQFHHLLISTIKRGAIAASRTILLPDSAEMRNIVQNEEHLQFLRLAITAWVEENAKLVQSIDLHDGSFTSHYLRTLKTILSEVFAEHLHPAVTALDVAIRSSRSCNGDVSEFTQNAIEEKRVQFSMEKVACDENTSDIILNDLQNIFLRCCFREVKSSVLKHMIEHNFPLSPHCAGRVFDAVMHVLDSLRFKEHLEFVLLREKQWVLKYTAVRSLQTNSTPVRIVIRMKNDTFYVLQNKEHIEKDQCGLFEALCDNVKGFTANFGLVRDVFLDQLMRNINKNQPADWSRHIEWHGSEKLHCAVAIS